MAETLGAVRLRGPQAARTTPAEVEPARPPSGGRRVRRERRARPRSAADDQGARPQQLADAEARPEHARVREDLRHVLHVLCLLVVGDLEGQLVAPGAEEPTGM